MYWDAEDGCPIVYMVAYMDQACDRARVNESWRYFL
jgi:hypothetical protein